MRRAFGIIAILTGLAALLLVGGVEYARFSRPLLPPLLRGVTAASGWWGACPPRNEQETASHFPLALSPELNQKLTELFPPGSSEDALVQGLAKQGFVLVARPCDNDSTIHQFFYKEQSGGLFHFPITANVYWKADSGKVVWTKGFAAFGGL